MFAVTIAFGSMAWRLLYKDEEKAKAAYAAATPPNKTVEFNPITWFELVDDFGQRAAFSHSAITAIMFEDMDASKLANIEMALHNARTQASAEQRAAADPTLRAARSNGRGGPAIVSPGFNS